MEFSCSICNYSSSRKYCVKTHINKKNKCGENPQIIEILVEIRCEYCDKLYKTKANLKEHYKVCKKLQKPPNEPTTIRFEFDEDDMNFIYLLKEREFIRSKEHIFKLGFTTKDITSRGTGYPKGSKFYCCIPVAGNPELELINQFRKQFKHRTDIGNEYFEGDFQEMFNIIHKIY